MRLALGIDVGSAGGVTPAVGSVFDLQFRRGVYFGATPSFTRATVADWANAAGTGLTTQAASGVLRRDDRGALFEEARTNLFLNSFAPVTRSITVTAATTYTVSRGPGAGTVTVSDALTGTPTFGTPLSGSAATTTLTVTVSGSVGWVNVEAAASATSPISTAGTSATRNADVWTTPATLANTTWTIAGTAQMPTTPQNVTEALFNFSLDANNRIALRRDTASPNTILATGLNGGGLTVGPAIAAPAAGAIFGFCLRLNGSILSLSIDGSAPSDSASLTFASGLNSLQVGSNFAGTGQWNGFIRRVVGFNTAASNGVMQSYSTASYWAG